MMNKKDKSVVQGVSPAASLQNLATHLSSFSKYEMKPCRRTGEEVPTLVKKEFPLELIPMLQMISGNNMCPDCYIREKLGDEISDEDRVLFNNTRDDGYHSSVWANVQFGTLICATCAEHQINMHKEVNINTHMLMFLGNSYEWA